MVPERDDPRLDCLCAAHTRRGWFVSSGPWFPRNGEFKSDFGFTFEPKDLQNIAESYFLCTLRAWVGRWVGVCVGGCGGVCGVGEVGDWGGVGSFRTFWLKQD